MEPRSGAMGDRDCARTLPTVSTTPPTRALLPWARLRPYSARREPGVLAAPGPLGITGLEAKGSPTCWNW